VPVPRALRALVRFSRLSDRTVATVRRVLDDDADFRSRVWAAVEAAPGRDELGAASLLFLERPDGWEPALDELAVAATTAAVEEEASRADAAAVRRLATVEAALARAEAELAPLRDAADALRTELADARRARRTAESELGRLRKRIGELEAAASEAAAPAPAVHADVAAWAAAVAAAEARAARAESDAAAERDRADASAAAARPEPAPDAPAAPVDRAAVADAVASAVAAVASLAEALGRAAVALTGEEAGAPGWPPPGMGAAPAAPGAAALGDRSAPAPRRVPVPLPRATFDDTVEAFEHLLRVPRTVVFVDGYNVTLSVRGDAPLPDQRRWLVDAASGLAARTGAELEVVFDGAREGGAATGERRRHLGVRVRFTGPDVEADDEILGLVAGLPIDRPATVVSDDRRVRDGARRLGANVVGVAALAEALRRSPA
jgi:predicted RNA-binding protein with PIN domain